MKNALALLVIILSVNLVVIYSKISDQRLCADPNCKEPISLAKSVLRYMSDDANILSFMPNEKVTIYSKSAGSRLNLWGAEINGKRGYIPLDFVRETKILHSKPKHLVATEIVKDRKKTVKSVASETDQTEPLKTIINAEQTVRTVPYVGVAADIPSPNKVSQPYEVIDGTTVYYNTDGSETNFEVEVEKDSSNSFVPDSGAEQPNVVDEETKHVESKKIPADSSETEFAEKLILPENKLTEQNLKDEKLTNVVQPLFDSINGDKNQISTEANEDEMSVESEDENDSLPDEIDNNDDEEEEEENSESQEKSTVEEIINDEKLTKRFENTSDSKEESLSSAAIEDNVITTLNSDTHLKLENKITKLINGSENNVSATENILIEKIPNTIKNNKLLESFENEKSEKSVSERNIEHSEIEKIKTDPFLDPEIEEIKTEPSLDPEIEKIKTEPSLDPEIEKIKTEPSLDSEKNNINHFTDINEEAQSNSKKEDFISTTLPLFKLSEIVTDNNNNNMMTAESPPLASPPPPQMPLEKSTAENSVTERSTTEAMLIENVETATSESTENFSSLFDSLSREPEKEKINESQEDNKEPPKSDHKLVLKNEHNIEDSGVQISYTDSNEKSEKKVLSDVVLKETSEIDQQLHQNSEQTVDQTNLVDGSAVLERQSEASFYENNLPVEDSLVNLQLQDQSQQSSDQNTLPEEVSDDGDIKLPETVEEIDEPGFFSGLYNSIFQSFIQSDLENSVESNEQMDHFVEIKQEYFKNKDDMNTCQRYDEMTSQCFESSDERITSNKVQILSMEFGEGSGSVLIYLVITSLTLLIFTLGYYYIEKRRRDEFLIAKINELEKALLVSAKECAILQDDIQKYRDKLSLVENTFVGSDSMVLTLKEELDEIKAAKAELEEQNSNLEKELETATDAGLELNRILSDFLSSQSGSDTLVKTVNHMQKQLNSQQETISEMNTTINSKVNENEILQSEISNAKEKIAILQMELETAIENMATLEKEKLDNENEMTEQNRKLQLQMSETVQGKISEIATLQDELAFTQLKLKDTTHLLNVKENELTILQNKIKGMHFSGDKTETSENIIEISHIQAELQQVASDKEILIEKLQKAEQIRINIENHTKSLNSEMVDLKAKTEEAEREKIEAQTRLEVLSGYFKDKESQLQKELQRLEGLWLQNQGETNSTVERMKSLQEEIKNYKLQSEMLKQEIIDQEVCLKSQISVLEKKAHENWLLARQAERKLEESKQEASQLRNRLTLVEKNFNNSTQHAEELKEQYRVLSPPINTNGDISNSPIHLASMESPASPPLLFSHRAGSPSLPFLGLPPPPPPGVPFLPPPPGVPFMPPPPTMFPGDRRPPPLGRMSSPPPPNTFSPSSRNYSLYNRDGSPPPSPPRNPYRSSDSPYRDMDVYRHQSPPLLPYVNRDSSRTNWEDTRQGFKPPHDQRRKQKGSALSSGSEHSSGSVGKINRENQNV